MAEQVRERRARRNAEAMGYRLQKSRVQNPHLDDLGGWRVLDIRSNAVVAGAKFDLDLNEVENVVASN